MKTLSTGFTFIELAVSLSILGVLAMLAFPMLEHSLRRQKEAALKQALFDIRTALDAYQTAARAGGASATSASGYPASLDELVNNRDEHGQRFLRAVPSDPFSREPAKPAAATWLLRSYQSPPGSAQPGADVFDVHSSSSETGTNGVPYRDW